MRQQKRENKILNSESYFSRLFKQKTGKTPLEYRSNN
ncbi:MAG: AraC family transcriptional regulator [Bacteroidetes bacterium]|nr:AraC family transcriptional regulator [Bacteroidota bacterium]